MGLLAVLCKNCSGWFTRALKPPSLSQSGPGCHLTRLSPSSVTLQESGGEASTQVSEHLVLVQRSVHRLMGRCNERREQQTRIAWLSAAAKKASFKTFWGAQIIWSTVKNYRWNLVKPQKLEGSWTTGDQITGERLLQLVCQIILELAKRAPPQPLTWSNLLASSES